ncbi:Tripartite-type tricarboxylate transporter, receptor component TctC [Variovorax sp. HW608]|uniref:Bug family tripartite tricarboxylate transporter substrate binding protein n=1 Tax=Variovorax sp. HW608 TaxID=1034889 RepID=UPI0008200266|nr:tripartite tricarboxylate transporter substrate binding protein [Variovorax sp. HW608]SCK30263.1 Tripartite-type tricarboxylate transporter, receptor component TctC [Variovorax sp. HW608]
MNWSKKIWVSAAVAAFAGAAGVACAQEAFPSKPITIVVPYPAGGTSDAQIRIMQDSLTKLLGQPIIVDNKPGASGAIAAQFVARAKPDGYTLLYPNNGVLIAPLLNPKLGYDPLKDLKPVTQTTAVPMVLVAGKSVPGDTVLDFLKYARSQPNGIQYASAGTASFGHLASARFAQMAGIKVEHVPYKGEANTTMAVRMGEVQMLLTTPSSSMLGQVEQGNIKLLGVSTPEPSPLVPGAPTLNKTVPGFTAEVWFGLMAPAGTPDDVVAKLNASVRKVMDGEEIRARLMPTGALPKTSTPEQFGAMMKAETVQWRDLIAKFNIKAD